MSRKRNRHINLKLVSIVLLLVVIVGVVVHNRLDKPLPVLEPQTLPVQSSDVTSGTLDWPTVGQAAIGLNQYGIEENYGAQTPAPTASIAKLITALAVLKVHPLSVGQQGPTLTMSATDVNYYDQYVAEDGSVAQVAAGEQISEYQMLEGMLLPSANNMADSLAVWSFGSLTAYAAYANHMLPTLGLDHTHVGSDASGFTPDTTSTASDLVKLGELVYANPVLADIISLRQATLPVAGTVKNVNWLLGTDGINGIKTGNSNQAGGVYLFSAPYRAGNAEPVTIIGALMQNPTLQMAMDNSVPLLTSVQKGFQLTPSLENGQAIGQYTLPWGGEVTAVTKNAVNAITWQGKTLSQPTVTLLPLHVPMAAGSIVGSVSYASLSGSSSPAILSRPIPEPPIWWRILH
jgi:serine-type D-Ala-D-Ala carboxypeptidase (penicillin-binding protein 5/6)